MKKLIFFTMLMLFLSIGLSSFSAPVPIKECSSKIKTEKVTLKRISEKDLNFWWCTATVISVTPVGEDMEGNIYYDVEIQVNCVWIEMHV